MFNSSSILKERDVSEIELIVIGGSAGALPVLGELVRKLPDDFQAALCIALHTSTGSPGLLPDIVGRKTQLRCLYGRDGQPITPGTIYFAPVDRHLLIEDGRLRVTHGPRENGFRPAVDPLFRTAARAYDRQVAGVVLSGSLGDGSSGLAAIKKAGGVSIVQNPEEALFPACRWPPSRASISIISCERPKSDRSWRRLSTELCRREVPLCQTNLHRAPIPRREGPICQKRPRKAS